MYDGGTSLPLHKNAPQHRMRIVQEARIKGIVLRQRDGSVKVLDTKTVLKEMFL